jgi:hypothetical protein
MKIHTDSSQPLYTISFKLSAFRFVLLIIGFLLSSFHLQLFAQPIPLPEHPRPDFERTQWKNLNGIWQFEFDSLNQGITKNWNGGNTVFNHAINVPFPWGSTLSGVADKADIGWYKREISISPEWKNKRVFITLGASDWETSVWLDGKFLGTHQGGYTPFSFELTEYIKYGQSQKLVVRADDARRSFTLYGKQGYGNARGIWQTVYLEARGKEYLEAVHFSPDIDKEMVNVTAYLPEYNKADQKLSVSIKTGATPIIKEVTVLKGKGNVTFSVSIPKPRLWTLEDPYLYEAEVALGEDIVKTYFGMRKISVVNLPGTEFPYIALNNKPVYVQLALDQAYHPEGYYTFPSDEFMKQEIIRSKEIGLNGIRTHIKTEIPRKLYWADKLGLLVMSDLPNSWGEPDEKMQCESEYTLREMIKRDYNHPSIFSWIIFNETWGLQTRMEESGKQVSKYLPETQQWVVSMYYLAKSLDPTRLVEDNSICCGAGHTVTDINSFHDYLPGWEWENHLKNLTEKSFEGSTFQFEPGFVQGKQPKINSECGNVWGYEGSTGDVDYSWDYHRMMNTFRKYPEIAGWLYTEHHDVINEWNGYWRFDRSKKYTGLEELVPGMKLNDFHSAVYISTGNEICKTVKGGEQIEVPLYLSSMSSTDYGNQIKLNWQLSFTNVLGQTSVLSKNSLAIDYQPYIQKELSSLKISMPELNGLAMLTFQLQDSKGTTLHHNFMHFEIISENKVPKSEIISVAPGEFTKSEWSGKQWWVLGGLKMNGTGNGYFQYTFKLDKSIKLNDVKESYFLIELSAKELFVKDMDKKERTDVDYMLGGKASPSANFNSYPMTDEKMFPSKIEILVDGNSALTSILPDDPADHRGVLSWHHQLKDRNLREAGSYGYLTKVTISKQQLKAAVDKGEIKIQIKTLGEGGVAVYGKSFGRYPLDPSLVLIKK